MQVTTKHKMRLTVTCDESMRVFEMPLPPLPTDNFDQAVTAAASAFAKKLKEEVRRAQELHGEPLVA
jgi:hypothetical protein